MADVTCKHNWCERQADHGTNPDDYDVHEAPARTVSGRQLGVSMQVSYRGGDSEPLLYVSDAELTLSDAEELLIVLAEQVKTMRSVQPTPALSFR